MFLVALTKFDISDKLSGRKYETFQFQKKRLTIVYDDFLSKIDSQNELCVIESPLISHSNAKEIVFSQVRINNEKGIMDVSRPSVSGRPIYYHVDAEGNFYCSSHILMLKQVGVIIRENKDVLPEFFVFRFVLPPQTLYENICQLGEGSRLEVKLKDEKCKLEVINEFNPRASKNLDEFKDFRERIYDLTSKSIRPLGVSKNRLAILLSGGLDSSLLLKMCQDQNFQIDETYSTGWPFEPFEKEYAISSANYFGTTHRYYEITLPQYVQGLIEAISAAEQPLPHMQSVLIHLLFKEGLPKNKDIVLNGQGSELSCNSTNYLIYRFKRKSLKIEILKLMGKLPIASNCRGAKWATEYQSKIDCSIEDPNSVLWSQDPLASFSWAANYFNVKQSDIIRKSFDVLKQFGEHSIYETVALYDFIGGNLATQSTWSKLGENQQKIVYYPFNNMALVNYLLSIPDDIDYKKYKHVFKETASYCGLPNFIVNRRKLGFNPLTNLDLLKEKVFEPLIPVAAKVFDEHQIRAVKPTDWGYDFWTLWNILNYSIWKRLFIQNEPKEKLIEELATN